MEMRKTRRKKFVKNVEGKYFVNIVTGGILEILRKNWKEIRKLNN